MLLAYSFDMANYKELYQTIVCTGKAMIEGQMCYKVEFISKLGSIPITRYFAIDAGVPLKTDYTITQGRTKIRVESWESDFKLVDGILYPHHTREKAMNVLTDTRVESIEHNVQIPTGRLDLPASVKKILDDKPDKHKQLDE